LTAAQAMLDRLLEAGRRAASVRVLWRIAAALGVSGDAFLPLDDT